MITPATPVAETDERKLFVWKIKELFDKAIIRAAQLGITDSPDHELGEIENELRRRLRTLTESSERGESATVGAREIQEDPIAGPILRALWEIDMGDRFKNVDGYEDTALLIAKDIRAAGSPSSETERFFALVRTHAYEVRNPDQERVPAGTRYAGTLWVTAEGEVVVTDTSPSDEMPEDDPLAHNCDEMGCSTVSHVIARLRSTTTQEDRDG